MKKTFVFLLIFLSLDLFSQTHELVKIDSFGNSKIIIFPEEISKNFVPDSVQTFTPTRNQYYNLLHKIERKSFKSWNKFYKWFHQNGEIKSTRDTLFLKMENEWAPINTVRKRTGDPNVYVQVWGAYYQNKKLLQFRIIDLSDNPKSERKNKIYDQLIDGNGKWFEENLDIIIIDLRRKKALNSLDLE